MVAELRYLIPVQMADKASSVLLLESNAVIRTVGVYKKKKNYAGSENHSPH
jgi:hypothetical protein